MYTLTNLRSVFLLVVACTFSLSSSMTAQNWWGNGIKGEGPIVEKEINLDRFTGFDMASSAEVVIKQGKSQRVVVEGQQNIIDELKTEVRNGIWRIGFKKNISNYKKFVVHITIPELTYAELSGSGNIESKGSIKCRDLKTTLSGSGNISMDIDAAGLLVKLSGSGNIVLDGQAGQAEMKISGSGNIKCYNLVTQNTTASISGSGNLKLHAVQSLDANVSGSGNIYYKGSPEKLRSKVSGSGDIVSRN